MVGLYNYLSRTPLGTWGTRGIQTSGYSGCVLGVLGLLGLLVVGVLGVRTEGYALVSGPGKLKLAFRGNFFVGDVQLSGSIKRLIFYDFPKLFWYIPPDSFLDFVRCTRSVLM